MRPAILLVALAAPCATQSYVVSPAIYSRCEGPSQNTFPFTGTFLTPTAQAAALDATQPLGLAVSNGIASVVPPLLPTVQIGRIYASGAPASTSGTLTKTSGLVTRFRY